MQTSIQRLTQLVAPVPLDVFFRRYYKQDMLYVRDQKRKAKTLFTSDDADLILREHCDSLEDFVRVGYEGTMLFAKKTGHGNSNLGWLLDRFQQGWTIVIDYVQRFSLPVARLVRALETELGCPFDVSAFLTPANAPGIAPHCDRTDVFILQIEGSKAWRLYGPSSKFLSVTPKHLEQPTRDLTLKPGDVLYLPRGHIHQGCTHASPSLSLSIKPVDTYCWIHFYTRLLDIAAQAEPELQRSVPMNRSHLLDSKMLHRTFKKVRQHIQDSNLLAQTLQRTTRELITTMPSISGSYFQRYEMANRLTLEDEVERVPDIPCYIETRGDTELVVSIPRCSIDGLPVCVRPTLEFIRDSSSRYRVADLPGAISERTKLVLAKRLVREGLLRATSTG